MNVYPVLDLYLGAVNIEMTSILKYSETESNSVIIKFSQGSSINSVRKVQNLLKIIVE